MTRTKVNIEYIAKDAERKSTFKRRKKGLMKKAEELSILCAVNACAIIFCPYDLEPDVWPSQLEVQLIITKLRNMSPLGQNRRMIDQKDFISQQLTRVNEQVAKQHREVRHKKMTNIMFECLNGKGFEYLNMSDLNDLNSLLSQNIRAIERRI
ncbi:agamous-like MADS-box protein AGL80 [Rhododendron vialii]|uniref:agamous-like MADS-box protein AGL80 n=1 Tax=Rhododendron vialii TaxID=182163 RepID=UPI00266034C0|nr:agamous-like MADS-box protein AGL80 [Rhododendron vialii]